MGTIISHINHYVPPRKITNAELEQNLFPFLKENSDGLLYRIFGIDSRYFAEKDEMVSDMAATAAIPLLDLLDRKEIDLLLFCSACSDMIEPATAAIIQSKLGLHCPAIDVKNACNSFVSGLHFANALLQSGFYKKILILSAEKLSDSIRSEFRSKEEIQTNLAAYSFGDAAAAVIVEFSKEKRGIFFEKIMSKGAFWDLCTVPGGGSFGNKNVDMLYFSGKTTLLQDVFEKEAIPEMFDWLRENDLELKRMDHVFCHQISSRSIDKLEQAIELPPLSIKRIFPTYGNVAAASIPLALSMAVQNKEIREGQKVSLIGFAAGISYSIQTLTW